MKIQKQTKVLDGSKALAIIAIIAINFSDDIYLREEKLRTVTV